MYRLIAFAFLAGCAAGEALQVSPNDRPCFSARDCFTGFVCLENQCVMNDVIGPDQVHVEIDPPDGTPYARTQLLDQRAIGGVLPLNLAATAEYQVKVLLDGELTGARVTFFGENRIPDREDDLTQVFNSGSGTVRLLPGTYSARISLIDRSRPGFEASGFTVRNGDALQTKEFVVPSSYRRLEGTVVSSVSGSTPIPGVIVEATGQQSRLPSTQMITGQDGRYSLLLPETAETQFILTARLASSSSASWSFEELVRVDAATRQKDIELEIASNMRRGRVRLQVVGLGPGGPEAVSNANVTLTASTTTGLESRRYSISGVTNTEGYVVAAINGTSTEELPFLTEHYTIEVKTPARSPFASRTVVKEIAALRDRTVEEQITLQPRTQVLGSVLSASGNPVEDALLEMLPLDPGGRSFDAETAWDGTFLVGVDPGRYLIVIRPQQPQAGELLPVHTVVQVIADLDQVTLPPFELPLGTQVFGTVRGQQTGGQPVPVARARVEFFVHQEDHTISIARTYSDSSGAYSVVLPNPPN